MKRAQNPALLLRLDALNVSHEFNAMARLNGFVTLEDVLTSDLDKLPMREGSGMRMLTEALELLEAHGLGRCVED